MDNQPKAKPFRFCPPCDCCGRDGASVEVIAPGGLPQRWGSWSDNDRRLHLKHANSTKWRLLYRGVYAGSGPIGDPIGEQQAADLYVVLHLFDLAAVRARFWDGLGWCLTCQVFYCTACWPGCTVGDGYLMCPRDHIQLMDRY